MSRSRSSTGASAASTNTRTIGFMPTTLKRQPSVLSRATVTGTVSRPAVTEQQAPPYALKRALTCPTRGSKQDARTGEQRTVSNPGPTSLTWRSQMPTPDTMKPGKPKLHRRTPTTCPGAKSAPHVLHLPVTTVHDSSSADMEADKHDPDEFDGFADNEADDLPEPTIHITIAHAGLPSQETGYFDIKTHLNPANAYYSYAFAQEMSSDELGSPVSSKRKDSASLPSLPSLSCDDTFSDDSGSDTDKDPQIVEGTFRHYLHTPKPAHPGKLNISTQDLHPQVPALEAKPKVASTCLPPTSPDPEISWIDEQVQLGLRRAFPDMTELDDLRSPQPLRLDPSYIATNENFIYHGGEALPIPTLSYSTTIERFEDGSQTLVINTVPPPEGVIAGRKDRYGDAPSHTPIESELTRNDRFMLANNHDEHQLDPWELLMKLQTLATWVKEVETEDGAEKAEVEFRKRRMKRDRAKERSREVSPEEEPGVGVDEAIAGLMEEYGC